MARLMAASSFMCRRWLSQMLITRPPYCGSSPSSGPRLDRHARRYYPMASTACTAGAIDPDEEEAPRVSAAAESHPHISRGKTAAAGQSLGPCALCSSWRNPDPRLAAPPRRGRLRRALLRFGHTRTLLEILRQVHDRLRLALETEHGKVSHQGIRELHSVKKYGKDRGALEVHK